MNCASCGFQLESGVAYCPQCGTPAPNYYPGSGASGTSQNDPTIAARPYSSTNPPQTGYGSNPHYSQSEPAYNSNPYNAPTAYGSGYVPQTPPYGAAMPSAPIAAPPPPPAPQSNQRLVIILLALIAVVIIVGASVFAFLIRSNITGGGPNTSQTATAIASAQTATAIALQNPYPPYGGTLVLNDPLTDNSKGYQWDEGKYANGGTCGFSNGAYHVGVTQHGYSFSCNPEAHAYTDFAFQVDMTIVKGDQGGVDFRQDNTKKTTYYFLIGADGSYQFFSDNGNTNNPLKSGSSDFIKKGLGQVNTLGIVAQGSKIDVYINLQFLFTINDSTSSSGLIGLTASAFNVASETSFNNARVWQL